MNTSVDSGASVARKKKNENIVNILNIDTPSVTVSKGVSKKDSGNQSERKRKTSNKKKTEKIKKSVQMSRPRKRRTQSHDQIKKGFNVCYALDEFIRTSQMYHNEIHSQH